ncbi:MAG: hypothetical protein HYU78_14070 [Rhodocyclales bacterium]|nr:hypothetical protein [Rhodocyclales bacterium]
MNIQYKPVAFHPDTDNLQVLYFNRDLPGGVQFSIEIPRIEGKLLAGEALDALIRSHAPVKMFEAAAQSSPGADQPHSPAPFLRPAKPHLFDVGTAFVAENQEILFLRRPLPRINGLAIPVDIV